MRRPQEEAARSTHNGAKTKLSDGVSFRDVRDVGLDDDPKRYTQLLKPSLELRPSIAVYFSKRRDLQRQQPPGQPRGAPLPLHL